MSRDDARSRQLLGRARFWQAQARHGASGPPSQAQRDADAKARAERLRGAVAFRQDGAGR